MGRKIDILGENFIHPTYGEYTVISQEESKNKACYFKIRFKNTGYETIAKSANIRNLQVKDKNNKTARKRSEPFSGGFSFSQCVGVNVEFFADLQNDIKRRTTEAAGQKCHQCTVGDIGFFCELPQAWVAVQNQIAQCLFTGHFNSSAMMTVMPSSSSAIIWSSAQSQSVMTVSKVFASQTLMKAFVPILWLEMSRHFFRLFLSTVR